MTSALDFYAAPAAMSALPQHPLLDDLPVDPASLRSVVQGLLVHRDWAAAYGLSADEVRVDEQNLRSVRELLDRAFALSNAPLDEARPATERVLCICRHFALLYTSLLRAAGVPARTRCGFGNYFDRAKWYDHWITERWHDGRWVSDDPQVDALQARMLGLVFDPYDQPPAQFLSGAQAWVATRRGELDPEQFGIFDMWGSAFIAGSVLSDLACLNKVELLPWDAWGLALEFGPHDVLSEQIVATIDDVAALVLTDDIVAIRERYLGDDRLRVPAQISTFVDGATGEVAIDVDQPAVVSQQ